MRFNSIMAFDVEGPFLGEQQHGNEKEKEKAPAHKHDCSAPLESARVKEIAWLTDGSACPTCGGQTLPPANRFSYLAPLDWTRTPSRFLAALAWYGLLMAAQSLKKPAAS